MPPIWHSITREASRFDMPVRLTSFSVCSSINVSRASRRCRRKALFGDGAKSAQLGNLAERKRRADFEGID